MKQIPKEKLAKFFELAFERHRIYVLKELGLKKPWTDDKIFQNWFFCNVFRRIDKTTVWMEDHIIKPNEDDPDLWKNIMLYRYISNIRTFKALAENCDDCTDRKQVYKVLRCWQQKGETIFTSAFICNSKGVGGTWTDKVTYIFTLLKEINENGFDIFLKNVGALSEVFKYLRCFSGVGNFMAYEYTTDFSYSQRYLANSPEIYTWCDLGLGAVRGLNRLIHEVPTSNIIENKTKYLKYIFEEWKIYIKLKLKNEIDKTLNIIDDIKVVKLYKSFNNLTMREVEHWLCEYDKYCRGGSKKRRYNGYQ